MVVGFFPSYFGRLAATDAAHHFHGITATFRMVMLIGQGWSARVWKFSLHRWVGWSSVVIAPLFVISGLMMVQVMLNAKGGFTRIYGVRLAFVAVTTMLWFSTAFGLAICYRRQIGLHAAIGLRPWCSRYRRRWRDC